MLVPWGLFAQRIGLVEALEGVSISQPTRDHTPQTKLIELLVSVLMGCAHLKDISHGPHPFVRLAAAWLHETCPDAPPSFDRAQASVKQMVHIATNTSAWVIWQPGGCLLRFTELSAFAGTQLVIGDATPIQLVLPP